MNNTSTGTCLVTGALGFLGRRIVAEFAAAGYRVVGLDRHPSGTAEGMVGYTAAALPGEPFEALLRAERPNVIIHTAGPASVGASLADPASDFSGSVDVLFGVLDAIRRNTPEARLVTLSSAAVYGDPRTLPVDEEATLTPVSPYGFHKAQCESLLREFHQVYGLCGSAVRIFSAYGPGLRRQLLWDVCDKASTGSVTLFGTGDETRDFIHADDVAFGVRVVAENAPLSGDVYNLASGVETTVREVAGRLVSVVAPGSPITFSGEVRPGDPRRWRADIARISALGFAPRVTLAEGLIAYGAWYREVRESS